MELKEKVLHGLDSCGFYDGIPNICEVTECPYRDNKAYCVHQLAHDAGMLISELLQAQEPRVMTYDEMATFDGAFLIESSDISQLDWVFFFDTDTKSDAIWVEGFDGERYVVYREDYGTYTRCWTSRPSKEEMEATPWN